MKREKNLVKIDQNQDILIFLKSSNVSYWESFNVSFFLISNLMVIFFFWNYYDIPFESTFLIKFPR
jgi:hypothetical protein